MNNKVMFSSAKDDWATPVELFDKIKACLKETEWHDVCASEDNTKCKTFWTKEDDALSKEWDNPDIIYWMNPPYGRSISKWVKKAKESAIKYGSTVACLLPCRTDTKWFHEDVLGSAFVLFIKGRVRFVGAKYSAPFPSCVVVFDYSGKLNHDSSIN